MQSCWLQGATDDALRALCCPVAYNIRWLLKSGGFFLPNMGREMLGYCSLALGLNPNA